MFDRKVKSNTTDEILNKDNILNKMSDEQLVLLRKKIDKEFERRQYKKIASNFKDEDCVIHKINSYTLSGDKTSMIFIVDRYNRILGFNNESTELLVGKMNNNYKLIYFSFDITKREISCFDGKINFNSKCLDGTVYGNIIDLVLPKMNKFEHQRKINKTIDVNLQFVNNDIDELLTKLYHTDLYTKDEKNIVFTVFDIK